MAYRRDSFGIEYRPDEPSEDTPWLLWALGVAAVVALAYLSKAGYVRAVAWLTEKPSEDAGVPVAAVTNAAGGPVVPPVAFRPPPAPAISGPRPRQVDNLWMRLERAIATTNVALQVSTIEQIRSLPGSPAADRDDDLARMLGPLKMHMLFGPGMHSEWVKTIEVKRGNSASRIAAEYGTTLRCLEKLNGDVSSLKVGRKLKVMDHPQFRLAVYRKTEIADLFLDGRFFKRYYLLGEVTGANGSYTFGANTRALLSEKGVKLVVKDVSELEMLLPKGANMTIADFR